MEILNNSIWRVYTDAAAPVTDVRSEHWQLRFEVVPEDEALLEESEQLVMACHCKQVRRWEGRGGGEMGGGGREGEGGKGGGRGRPEGWGRARAVPLLYSAPMHL